MIRAVLFDFGQTLVDSAEGFRAAEREAEAKLFSFLGGASWDEFLSSYRRIRGQFHLESNFSRQAMWREVCSSHGRRPEAGVLEAWEGEYWERVEAKTSPFPETEEVLEWLSARYRLGLVTNTQAQGEPGKHRLGRFPGLERFFAAIMVAGESGLAPKPDPAPFLACLARLGVEACEAVYVGDDWRLDICGARGAGIQPIWLQHRSVRRSWPAVEEPVPRITGLDQLLDLERIIG